MVLLSHNLALPGDGRGLAGAWQVAQRVCSCPEAAQQLQGRHLGG